MKMHKLTQAELDGHLFEACKTKNKAHATLALATGANPNAVSDLGMTPLHVAAQRSSHDIIQVLLGAGADVSAQDNGGRLPIHYANGRDADWIVAAISSASRQQGHADRVIEERKDKGPPQVGG